ncbi:MAG TPA: hypothetical protein VMM92_02370 [Thermoanaerobaculia bacterium]|nr:hypothetical protein [Thermoanaerobaculia bacterium]
MRDPEHPHPALFLRFLRGEASKSENRAIVRHLLRGCRPCAAVGRPLWRLLDRAAVGQAEAAAKERRENRIR